MQSPPLLPHHEHSHVTSPRYNPMRGESWSWELTRSGACRHGGSHRRLALTHFGHKFEQNAISRHGKENAGQREHGAQQARKKRVHGYVEGILGKKTWHLHNCERSSRVYGGKTSSRWETVIFLVIYGRSLLGSDGSDYVHFSLSLSQLIGGDRLAGVISLHSPRLSPATTPEVIVAMSGVFVLGLIRAKTLKSTPSSAIA